MAHAATAQSLKAVSYADGQQKLNGLVTANTGKNYRAFLYFPHGWE